LSDRKLSRVNKKNSDSKEFTAINSGKVKKQFSNLQKGIAFVGSILSVIVASITITNNLSKPKTNTVKESTPSTVKVIHSTESVPDKSTSKSVSGEKSPSGVVEENGSAKTNTEESKTPIVREKEIIREVVKESSSSSTASESSSAESVPETKSSATNTETKSSDTETGTEEKIKE
jgi:hypothetical protein